MLRRGVAGRAEPQRLGILNTLHHKVFSNQNASPRKVFTKSQYSPTQILYNARYYAPQGIWSAEVLYNARYMASPNMLQAEAPRKWAPHSIIAHFPLAVNRQIAQTFNPKIVQNTIVQNDESHTKALKPTSGVDFSVLKR